MSIPNRGNILFLILLAVVLFAALSYAVTSSMRGGGQNASKESVQAGAASITQYVALIRSEVHRMMLVNDCKVANIDWRHDIYKRYNGQYSYSTGTSNSGAPPPSPKAGCAVFQAYGGPIAPQTFEKYKDAAFDAYSQASAPSNIITGHALIRWGNRKNELTAANDVIINFTGLNPALCYYMLNTQTMVQDTYIFAIDSNLASPADYTATADIVDDPINLAGDFFGTFVAYNSTYACRISAVLLAQ